MERYPEKPREACGLFGIHGYPEAAKITYFGLYALQHRGQEVPDVFKMTNLEQLQGESAIGHVRYSTTGSSILSNAQPFIVHHRKKSYAVAHNGNLVNAYSLKNELEETGSIFQTTMDSEIFLHLFVRNLKFGLEQALLNTVARLRGAFSFIVLTSRGEVVGIKDPNGFRPLCLGNLNGNYVLASETCALDLVEAKFVRELDPGEILIISKKDSTIFGHNVYQMRKAHGRRLAEEAPVDADLVMPFPDSGTYAALGYSEASGIPFEMAMIRNHYVGRTFIQPTQSM
jgi:amidophosphoribosyltransferase